MKQITTGTAGLILDRAARVLAAHRGGAAPADSYKYSLGELLDRLPKLAAVYAAQASPEGRTYALVDDLLAELRAEFAGEPALLGRLRGIYERLAAGAVPPVVDARERTAAAELHQRTVEHAKQYGLDPVRQYAVALKAVLSNDPALKRRYAGGR